MKILKYLLIILISCQDSKISSYKDRNMIAGTLNITDLYLIYSTWDSYIVVENKLDNQLLHKIKINDNCYAKPLINRGKLYFPMSDKQFSSYDLKTKKIDWTCEIKGVCRSFKLLNDMFIVNEKNYGISGINILTGKRTFESQYVYDENCSIPDLSPYYITFNDKYFYVCNWLCKTITAFDSTGKQIWSKTFGSAVSNAIAVKDYVFLGGDNMYEGGKIFLLNSETGDILFEQNNKFQVRFNPIYYNNNIYFYSYDNKLNRFDVRNKINEVVFNFDDTNNPGVDQMFLLDNNLYYSAGNPMFIYRFNLINHKLEKLKEAKKSLYGVYETNNKVEFIY